jgi:hypothetical protein
LGIADTEPQILQPKLIPRTSTTGVRKKAAEIFAVAGFDAEAAAALRQ